jgi:hypothetical protein
MNLYFIAESLYVSLLFEEIGQHVFVESGVKHNNPNSI